VCGRRVEAFLAATRAGDVSAILAMLAPDAMAHADLAALPTGRPAEVHGADAVAREIALLGSNVPHADMALVNGDVGIVIAPRRS
jgi:ketosteroid isomerase-like protein